MGDYSRQVDQQLIDDRAQRLYDLRADMDEEEFMLRIAAVMETQQAEIMHLYGLLHPDPHTKVTAGKMVMKDGKAWGVKYEDGKCREEGWVPLAEAKLSTSGFLKEPSGMTWNGSNYTEELNKGEIVDVVRSITVKTPDGKRLPYK